MAQASVEISGTPTGTLPDEGSYGCASIFDTGTVISFLIATPGDETTVGIALDEGATGTVAIDTDDAAVVSWNPSLADTQSSSQCIVPIGTRTSNGSVTITRSPDAAGGAGSFTIPALCDDTGAEVYTNVTGTFDVGE